MCSKFEQWGDNAVNGEKMAGNWGKWWALGTKKWKWGTNMV